MIPLYQLLSLMGWALLVFGFHSVTPDYRWEIQEEKVISPQALIALDSPLVKPVSYVSVPDLSSLSPRERKQAFVRILLPEVLLLHEQLKQDSLFVQACVHRKKGNLPLRPADSMRLAELLNTYALEHPEQLPALLHPHPVSITLAQAAIESGWGTSRFFRQAHNVFGMWSFDPAEPRMAARGSRGSRTIYVRKYEHFRASLRDYYRVLATSPAYTSFREVNRHSDNPYELIWELMNYSEQRIVYVRKLQRMLQHQGLDQYDRYRLDPEYYLLKWNWHAPRP